VVFDPKKSENILQVPEIIDIYFYVTPK